MIICLFIRIAIVDLLWPLYIHPFIYSINAIWISTQMEQYVLPSWFLFLTFCPLQHKKYWFCYKFKTSQFLLFMFLAPEFSSLTFLLLFYAMISMQVAILNGITMGGGAGISVPGTFRVATDKTVRNFHEI